MSDPAVNGAALLVVLLAAALAWQGLHERRTRTRRARRVDYGRPAVTTRHTLCGCGQRATATVRAGLDNWPVCDDHKGSAA